MIMFFIVSDLLDTYVKHYSDKAIEPSEEQQSPQYDEAWNPPGFFSFSLVHFHSLSLYYRGIRLDQLIVTKICISNRFHKTIV